MSSTEPPTVDQVEKLLSRLRGGDDRALDALVTLTVHRLHELASRMLRGFRRLKRWQESDDVLQGAAQRLIRAVRDVKPATAKDFYALAATAIRRELIDLHRQFFGPLGRARKYRSPPTDVEDPRLHDPSDDDGDPSKLVDTLAVHDAVDRLDPELRDVVDLLYYDGLDGDAAARVLGVSSRTVRRRWREARLELRREVTDAEDADHGEGNS